MSVDVGMSFWLAATGGSCCMMICRALWREVPCPEGSSVAVGVAQEWDRQ